jgi:Phage P2 GpU
MPAYFGSISLGFRGNGGIPVVSLSRKSGMRYHDHPIAQGMPMTEFVGFELHKVSMQITLWSPYTSDPTATIQALATARDGRAPLPLFIGNQLMGRGSSLFTLRSINEKWEIFCGPVQKAKVDLEFVEYSAALSNNQYLGLTSALGPLGALGGAISGLSSAVSAVSGIAGSVVGAVNTVGAVVNSVGSIASTVGGVFGLGGTIGGLVATASNVTGALSGAVSAVSGIGSSLPQFSGGVVNMSQTAASIVNGVTGAASVISAGAGLTTTLAAPIAIAGGAITVVRTAINTYRPLI